MMQEKRQYNLPFQDCNINENPMFKMLKCWHAKKEKSTCKYMQKYEHAERKRTLTSFFMKLAQSSGNRIGLKSDIIETGSIHANLSMG